MPKDKIKKSSSERIYKLMYTICLLTAGLAFICFFIGLLLGLTTFALYHLVTVFIYFYCAYISKKGNIYVSRLIFFILLNLGIVSTASYIGRAGAVEYMFVYSLALPFSVFSFKREKIYVYFFSCLSGLLWIILAITDFKLFTSTPIDISVAETYIYPISIFCTFGIVAVQLYYFSVLSLKYYKQIHLKKQKALEASLAKSKFLSTMSHEIRTPLNAVIGLSHILGNNDPRKDQIENIEALNYSGKTLLNLLNNVLDFSKMQSTNIELDNIPTNIISTVKQIQKIHKNACKRRNTILEIDIDESIPFVWLDVVRFNQVINNLISNAIKFTDDGTVTLIIKKMKETEEKVTLHLAVKDTGIGIPKNKQKTIWKAFEQASNTTNRIYGGTGLGLPIVKSILEVMHSKVKIESEYGKGSTFSFDLELKKADDKKEEILITEKKEHNLANKKVLLVDDNLINVMVGKQILEKEKILVNVANDGLSALNKCKENEFDIVLMDIQMPVMDGYTATKEIRKFNTKMPVLALSANVFIEIKDKIEECGMDGFIFKPFTPEDLINQIEKYTSNS
ncbi:response regulator [Polaribacter porphyrae]|uniref:histidine kinase n=1 Tax=Polaribacter porphyrae TaxID=1137780 RepID=A0A2S7WMI4_9FLAO|nr:response regulator [Polaribacter porphyrae]PQJ78825.1 two-component system sensor histidine kinase/response regulator [Polaribacter porphyrae]